MEKFRALLTNRDEPVRFDRDAFSKEFAHLLATPGYTTDQSQLKERGLKEFNMDQNNPTEQAEDALTLELDLLAEAVTDVMATTAETFMLSAPLSLTVKRPNNTYAKVAHVGSEDFVPVRCYVGKRNKLIFVFKPVMISGYSEMEMDEVSAKASLVGFKPFLNEKIGDLGVKVSSIRAQIASKQEQEKLADRHETYKDIGFGSW